MAGEYIEFNNNSQPAINDTNLNRLQQLIKQDIQGAIAGDTLPIGAIIPFGSDTIPANWLLCDGSEVSRTTYQDLFNTIGTSYGAGDGFTTFNLPDLRGRVGIGAGKPAQNNSSAFGTITQEQMQNWDFPLGETSGEFQHTLTIHEMPNHSHPYRYKVDSVAGGFIYSLPGTNSGATDSYYSGTDGLISPVGGGLPHNIIQPYIVANYIIKAFQSSGVVATVVDNLNSNSSTDALSAKQGKVLSSYSTTETIVGTWEDGKPVYRKTITGLRYNNDVLLTNVDTLCKAYGSGSHSGSGIWRLIPFYEYYNNLNYMITIQKGPSNNNVILKSENGGDVSAVNCEITIEYTKTTD